MRFTSNKFHLLALGLAFGAAAFFRFWAAPISAGPDVAQFWAFAKMFQLHGLDFYQYAGGDASISSIFPFSGWAFVYPPVWLLMLGLSLLAAPASSATGVMVDNSWRLAMKTPIIFADLAIGGLIYWAVPGAKWKKLLFASLWLFHPTAWYESAVFGQFDAIAAAFLLASVILFEQGKDRLAFVLAALAAMTKQHAIIPVVVMVVISARHIPKRRLISDCLIFVGIVVLLFVPFLVTAVPSLFTALFSGNFDAFTPYARLLFPGWAPGYQYPLVYAFSGSGALLTYLHDIFGWETSQFMQLNIFNLTIPVNILVLAIALVIILILSYRRSINLTQGALLGFLLFLGLSYQVNYQYLVIFIPLAILVASRTQYNSEKAFTLVLALLPAVWLWLFDVAFWFNYFNPRNPWVTPIFDRIGLVNYMPERPYAYVSLAAVLMVLFLTYVVLVLVRWRRKPLRPIS
jgi:hypothetical protein